MWGIIEEKGALNYSGKERQMASPAENAKVFKLMTKKQRMEREVFEEYFKQFGEVRDALKKLIKEYKQQPRYRSKRACYDRSAFYIGKGITRLSFYGCYVHQYAMKDLVDRLQSRVDLTGASLFAQARDLHVYLRRNEEK